MKKVTLRYSKKEFITTVLLCVFGVGIGIHFILDGTWWGLLFTVPSLIAVIWSIATFTKWRLFVTDDIITIHQPFRPTQDVLISNIATVEEKAEEIIFYDYNQNIITTVSKNVLDFDLLYEKLGETEKLESVQKRNDFMVIPSKSNMAATVILVLIFIGVIFGFTFYNDSNINTWSFDTIIALLFFIIFGVIISCMIYELISDLLSEIRVVDDQIFIKKWPRSEVIFNINEISKVVSYKYDDESPRGYEIYKNDKIIAKLSELDGGVQIFLERLKFHNVQFEEKKTSKIKRAIILTIVILMMVFALFISVFSACSSNNYTDTEVPLTIGNNNYIVINTSGADCIFQAFWI